MVEVGWRLGDGFLTPGAGVAVEAGQDLGNRMRSVLSG